MCLAVPGEVLSIEGQLAKVSISGVVYEAGLHLLEDVKVGDYVIVHSGYALEKLDPEEAARTLKTFEEFRQSGQDR